MPDDLKTFRVSAKSSSASGPADRIAPVDMFRAHFATWKPGAADPNPPQAFPLRSFCPEAPRFMADAGHFSARDMRFLSERYGFSQETPEAFYDDLLARIEDDPWLFAPIEMTAASHRSGMKVGHGKFRGAHQKLTRVAGKLPLNKLKLSALPDIEERLAAFVGDGPVEPALWVGAFCEYALDHYVQLYNRSTQAGITAQIESRLYGAIPETAFDALLSEAEDERDWSVLTSVLERLVEGYATRDRRVPDHVQSNVVMAAQTAAAMLDEDSLPGEIEAARALLGVAAKASATRQGPEIGEVRRLLMQLEMQFDIEFDDLTRTESERLEAEVPRGDVVALIEGERALTGLLADLAAAQDELEVAQAAGEWRKLAEIGERGERAQKGVDAFKSLRERLHGAILDAIGPDYLVRKAEEAGAGARQESGREAGADAQDVPEETDASAADVDEEPSIERPEEETSDDEGQGEAGQSSGNAELPAGIGEVTIEPSDRAAPQLSDGDDVAPDAADAEHDHVDGIEEAADVAEGLPSSPPVEVHRPAPVAESLPQDADPPEPAIDPGHLIEWIAQGRLGLAADAAASVEALGSRWPISAATLRVAAASRARFDGFDADAQEFVSEASVAAAVEKGDLDRVFLLGALLVPALMHPAFGLRLGLADLARGTLGSPLLPVADAASSLAHDFPPGADSLARIAGAPRAPLRERLKGEFEAWARDINAKSSRWGFATVVLKHIVSDAGPMGHALLAMSGSPESGAAAAREAFDAIGNADGVRAMAQRVVAERKDKEKFDLYPKTLAYIDTQLREGRRILGDWIAMAEREGRGEKTRHEASVAALRSKLEAAREALLGEVDAESLAGVVARWIAGRVEEAIARLGGDDDASRMNLYEALEADRDLLPARLRRSAPEPAAFADGLSTLLAERGVSQAEEAFDRALSEGAFDAASRIARRLGEDEDIEARLEAVDRRAEVFARDMRVRINDRVMQIKAINRVDVSRRDDMERWEIWCRTSLLRTDSVLNEGAREDLDDLPPRLDELDELLHDVMAEIREDQASRIARHRTTQNEENAHRLLEQLDGLTLESVEQRIAELRDGRSAATFEVDLDGVVADFVPEFIDLASGGTWPDRPGAFEAAFEKDGPLHVDRGRRSAASSLLSCYRSVCRQGPSGEPSNDAIRSFFEELGFENVRIDRTKGGGGGVAWRRSMRADIGPKDWFCPPAFGSSAKAGYDVLAFGPGTLPETVHKAVDPKRPSFLLFTGVVERARRHDIATRLRSTGAPVVLIDEALAVFAAIRTETRARVIFECGLPYGRIDPYTTDAGRIPPEMFFGREQEIRSIMSSTAEGCLVYGGRQLGKSALLAHVEDAHHKPTSDCIVVRRAVKTLGSAEAASAFWSILADMLRPDGVTKAKSTTADAVCRDVESWLEARPHGRIVCLFDEADHFLAQEALDDYPNIDRVKALMEDTNRTFKVVFAGLHNVQRMQRQPNSPLAHLGNPICIGPLNRTDDDKRAAHDLVMAPMRAAGFRFEAVKDIEEILSWANYYPSLIQEFSKGLLNALHGVGSGRALKLDERGPLWTIPHGTLFGHAGFAQIEARIRQKFSWTLDLDPRYALIANTVALLQSDAREQSGRTASFRTREVREHAELHWMRDFERLPQAAFDALLFELFELGVLGRSGVEGTNDHAYCLYNEQVASMLGSRDDIERALRDLQDSDPPLTYDHMTWRRRYRSAPAKGRKDVRHPVYAPLTDFQIGQLLRNGAPRVRFVCGLPFLGLTKIPAALKALHDEGHLPVADRDAIRIEETTDRKALARGVGQADGVCRLVLLHRPMTAEEAQDDLRWLETQGAVIDGHAVPVILLNAADEGMRDLATKRREETEFLSPWGAQMLRVHLDHIEEGGFDRRDARTAILQKTGGVPHVVVDHVEALRRGHGIDQDSTERSASVEELRTIVGGKLLQVLSLVEETSCPDDYDALNDLVRDGTGRDLECHGPDLLAIGLVSTWSHAKKTIVRSALGGLLDA